jgi:hypothetical protein
MAKVLSFGTVCIRSEFCTSCQHEAFVLDGKLDCCGCDAELSQDVVVIQVSEPVRRRKLPPLSWRKMILEKQANRCYYCEQEFGRAVYYKKRVHTLQYHWDHREAYAYSFNNRPENFVAACQFCNGWKSSKLFDSDEEIKLYVKEKWSKHGDLRTSNLLYRDVPAHKEGENEQVTEQPQHSVNEGLSDYIIRKRKEKAHKPSPRRYYSGKVQPSKQLSNKSSEESLKKLVKEPHRSAWRQRYEASLRQEDNHKKRNN